MYVSSFTSCLMPTISNSIYNLSITILIITVKYRYLLSSYRVNLVLTKAYSCIKLTQGEPPT